MYTASKWDQSVRTWHSNCGSFFMSWAPYKQIKDEDFGQRDTGYVSPQRAACGVALIKSLSL